MTDERIVRIATLANVTVERTRYYVTFPWPRDDERLAWLSLVSDTQLAFMWPIGISPRHGYNMEWN